MSSVSIIIPAYNVENYIERCILSCVNQTFDDIEIIVINDGSEDNTLEIIITEAQKDSRIRVINTNNNGVNYARSIGLNSARGKFILFLDSDDYLSKNAIEKCYEIVKNNNYDIVQFNYKLKYSNGEELLPWDYKFYKDNNEKVFTDYKYLDLLFNTKCNFSIWSKLIRKDFLIENNIKLLTNSSYGEDLAFTYNLAMYKPKVYILNEYLYYYFQRNNSLSNTFSKKSLDINKSINYIKKQLSHNNLLEIYNEEFNFLAYKHVYFIRRNFMYTDNELGKLMFKNWKKLNISISYNNNKYYRDLYRNEKFRGRIINNILKRSYLLGKIYYKMRYKLNEVR